MDKENLNKEIIKTLSSYIKSFYPLIYIYSFEEDRVEYYIEFICEKLKRKLYIWDIVDGYICKLGSPKRKITSDNIDYRDYENCLYFIEDKNNQDSVFLLKDFHPAFKLNSYDRIVRKIKNVIVSIRDSYKSIVFTIPPNCKKGSVPNELEKEIIIYDFPLITFEESQYHFKQTVLESFGGDVKIELNNQEQQRLLKAALGLTETEMKNSFIRAAVINNYSYKPECINTILEEKKQIIKKSGILEYYPTDVSLMEVGGLEKLKKWLQDNITMFDKEAQENGCEPPKGILLVGVPGCGKSLTAKTLASFWKMPLLRFDLGAVFGSLVGESEANMRKALEIAESIAPCVLWVDEIEKGLSGMTSAISGDSGTSQRVFGTLISWMQERQKPVFFIATANDIKRISEKAPELLRSGRFDEIFFIDLPNQKERFEIFSIHLKKRKEDPSNFDLDKLAKITSGYSGSDIEQIIKDAKRKSYISQKKLTTEIIEETVHERLPTGVTMKETIEEMRKWAESRAKFASIDINEEKIKSLEEYEKTKNRLRTRIIKKSQED